jgi:SAM-dependent methyltransferase
MRRALADVDSTMPELAAYLYDEIAQYLGGRVIDAGAGVGLYSRILLEHGKHVVALEGDPELVPALQTRLGPGGSEVYRCDLAAPEGLPEFASAESAVCINVAEHIRDDTQALRNIRERVAPGGKLVILVPAHPWLYNQLDKAIAHFRRYTRGSLLTLLDRSGWRADSITYFNSLSIAPWFITGTVFRKDVPGSSLIRLGGVVMPLMNWVDRNVARGKVGISLVAVATNPS